MLSTLRIAFRSLLRTRGFFTVSLVTLAVAIGATTAIYSVVDAVLLRPLPYQDPEELITVGLYVQDGPIESMPFSDRGFWHFHDANRSFELFGAFTTTQWPLVEQGDPVQLEIGLMSDEAFESIGVLPIRGRLPEGEEYVPNGPRAVLLSEALWQGRFGGDPGVIGRSININGEPTEVIGVLPDSYDFPESDLDAWMPLRLNRESENFGGHYLQVIARLRDGVTPEAANSDAESLIARFEEAGYGPEWLTNVFSGGADLRTLQESVVGESERPLLLVLGMVFFVLLIACGNVANLLLVRAEGRTRESAVRTALGASRWRLVEGVFAESIVLSVLGGVAGVLLAVVGIRILVAAGPASIPRLDEVGIRGSVLFFSTLLVVGCALLLSLFPAFRVGWERSLDSLRDGGRGATVGRERHRARSFLVVAQVALALVLLVGSVLMVRSFQELRSVQTGFDDDGLITFGLALSPTRYDGPEAMARFLDQLEDGLRGLPGVEAAGGINVLPLNGGGPVLTTQIEEFPTPEGDFPPAFPIRRVTKGYFETMGIPIVEGRAINFQDHDQRLGSALISASFKEQYWPDRSALGRRLEAAGAPAEIVGVVGDVLADGLDEPEQPTIYLPMLDSIGGGTPAMDFAVRTSGDPLALVPTIRNLVLEMDPNLPITDVQTMGGIVSESMSRLTFTMALLVLGAAIALFLGAVGIYGVISYIVTQRTAEIGIRQALGAAPEQVRGMVMRQGLVLTGIGIVIGLVATLWIGRSLTSLLYGVSAFDPVSFVGGSILFLGVAALASLIPALRAARIAPAVALREGG